MAKCAICGKSVLFGAKVSHSHRRSNKMWKPNVKKVNIQTESGNRKVYVCTSCLRSGKVKRASAVKAAPAITDVNINVDEVIAAAEALQAEAPVSEAAAAAPAES